MRTSFYIFRRRFIILFSLITLGCFYACLDGDDDEKIALPSTVGFNTSSQTVVEGNEAIIHLKLDNAASEDGFVTITTATIAVYNQDFTTEPAMSNAAIINLAIAKGQTEVQFKVSAIDNPAVDDEKSMVFTLSTATLGLKLGTPGTCTLAIIDDESPSLANFDIISGVVNETKSDGIDVKIELSTAAIGSGSINVQIVSTVAVYGNHFTTLPAASNNTMDIATAKNQTNVTFTVLPKNNSQYTDSLFISFVITSANGSVRKGQSLRYDLTIVDDEKLAIVNFAALSGNINENDAEGITVDILLSNPVASQATLEVWLSPGINAVYGQDFITEPPGFGGKVRLKVEENQSTASFKVLSLDNSYSNFYKTIRFTLSVISGPVKTGSNVGYDLTIIDNEIGEAAFAESSGLLTENNTSGIQVKVNFSKPLAQFTQLVIHGPNEYNNPSYGVRYFTVPEMIGHTEYVCGCDDYCYYCESTTYQNYNLFVYAEKGATSVEFTIIPIDNPTKEGNRNLIFSLFASNESPLIVTAGEFALTLVDND